MNIQKSRNNNSHIMKFGKISSIYVDFKVFVGVFLTEVNLLFSVKECNLILSHMFGKIFYCFYFISINVVIL